MLYTYFYYKNKKEIPIVFAFISILLIIVFITSFFLKQKPQRISASPIKIKKLIIGNISNNSASIYWFTQEKEIGWIVYGEEENKLNKIALDERDLLNSKKRYRNHYVVLKNLSTDKVYYFAIVIDNKLIFNDKKPFSFKTLSNKEEARNLTIAYGKVVDKNNQPQKEALIYLYYSQKKISYITLTKSNGEWVLPIRLLTVEVPQEIYIEVINEEGSVSSILTDLKNINPLPEIIIIGKNYNFLKNQEKVLSAISKNQLEREEVEIFYPANNMVIPGRKPLIKGRALPNNWVDIFIEGEKSFSAKLRSDKNGLWSYIPPNPLLIGSYKLKVFTTDINNNNIVLERKFTITGDTGSSVLGSATPSATITNQPTPTEYNFYPTLTTTPTPTPFTAGNNFINLSFFSMMLIIIGLGLFFIF